MKEYKAVFARNANIPIEDLQRIVQANGGGITNEQGYNYLIAITSSRYTYTFNAPDYEHAKEIANDFKQIYGELFLEIKEC